MKTGTESPAKAGSYSVCNDPVLPLPLDVVLQTEGQLNTLSATVLISLSNLTAHSSSPVVTQTPAEQIQSELEIPSSVSEARRPPPVQRAQLHRWIRERTEMRQE